MNKSDKNKTDKTPVLIVTGLSGAGISTAMKALEDIGYQAFDNFPIKLTGALIADPDAAGQAVAIGCDSRGRGFGVEAVKQAITALRANPEIDARLIFLQSSDDILRRRFSETRRVHPMAKDRPVPDGIIAERHMMEPLMDLSDRVINTSELSVHDLKRIFEGDYALTPRTERFQVEIISFGFKRGTPRQVDMLFDVRFMRNPHWDAQLRPYTGLDKGVQDYVSADPDFENYIERLKGLLDVALPRMVEEGRSYVTIAVGCTGGRHRSVFTAGVLAAWLAENGFSTSVRHRDLSADDAVLKRKT